jgi:hypothetical protein
MSLPSSGSKNNHEINKPKQAASRAKCAWEIWSDTGQLKPERNNEIASGQVTTVCIGTERELITKKVVHSFKS